ncbi:MAG: ice-binding family protein [Pseudomonadota bacterium]
MNVFKSTRTLVCAAGILLTSFLTACGGGGDQGRDPILGLPAAALVSVAVTPATATVQIGLTQQYTATANYADGSSHVVTTSAAWTSGSPLVGSVGAATGLATGLTVGSAQINASFGGKAGSANLSVIAPTLVNIAVTPATPSIFVGATQQFVATGNYSNGTSAVIASPVWNSASPLVATIAPTGLATGLIPGNTIISATSAGVTGNAVLTVNAVVVVPPGPPVPPVIPPVVPPLPGTVPMGGAGRFAVLAGTSITNNAGGLTLVSGDVGSPSQTVDPVQTAGWANFKSGAILALGLADLQVAITNANGRACTVSSAAGIDLGGKILTPGVYCYAGAITLTGTFIMNGPGVYIFRTASTLDTSANGIVAVAGGASASEVFWIPTGPTTLGANGAFLGSILGQSAAITVGDNTTLLTGRVLSAAAVTLRNNVIVK